MSEVITYANNDYLCYCQIKLDSGERILINIATVPTPCTKIQKLFFRGLWAKKIWEYNPTMAGGREHYVRNMTTMFADPLPTEPKSPLDKPTDYLIEHIEYFNQIFRPLYSPMVCEPNPWTKSEGGGYLSRKIPIIKQGANAHPDQLECMVPERMPLVFKALNGIQAVPWKINKKLLDVMNELWEKDPEIFKSSKDKKLNESQVKLYLDEANRYAEKVRIWLPANFDFRGRVYYLPFLNPQGPDMVRALFDFADGASVGNMCNIFAYGRTLYDDRISYDKRLNWFYGNLVNIQEVASRPLDNKWWREAKEKWQFLRWCLECCHNEWKNDVSTSPVYIDASCNAIQHIAALLRDKELAKSVNMCPLLSPQDIYDNITKTLENRLKELSKKKGEDSELAKKWLELKIGRSDIKKTIMTTPYGRTEYTNKEDIYEKFRDRLRIKNKKKAATWMNDILWRIVTKELPQNKLVMDWLRAIAKQFNKSNKHIEWAVPSGFLVRQRYFKYNSVLVELPNNKGKFRIRIKTDDIDTRKSRDAIVANFVHSLDASSLIMTVCQLLDAGKKNFAVIHDSFGVPSGDGARLGICAAKGFFQTHSGGLLSEYHNSFYGALQITGKDLPDTPQTGEFDITTVFDARYLFS